MSQAMDDLTALSERVWSSFLGRAVRRFVRMEGIDRCLVLSSQAFTALIPLLIVVSAIAPPGGAEVVARTIITKFGLSGPSADAVNQLFAVTGAAESSITVGSAVLLLYSGVSFTRRLQKMYRAAWEKEKAGVRGNVYAALALVVLLVEVLAVYLVMSLVRQLPADWLLALPLTILFGVVPWTSIPYLLMDRQVHWRRLLVPGLLTAVAMSLYGVGTTLYMPDAIERYTARFGLFGVTIGIIGWLLGSAGIIIACTAVGVELDESRAPWAVRLKKHFRLTAPGVPVPEPSAEESLGLTSADLVLLIRVAMTWLVMAGAVWLAAYVVQGIHVSGGVLTYLWLSLLLGFVNALLGPLLRMFVPGVGWTRFGLVALLVNGLLLEFTSWLSVNLDTDSLVSSLLGALVVSVAIAVYEFALRPFSPVQDEPRSTRSAESGNEKST